MTVKTAKRVRKPKLRLVSAEKQHYIQVPSGYAGALLTYLRGNGLRVSPPGPCTADSETIAFVGKVDALAVQGLLDRWK
jgi:hypothetical protein